MILLVTDRNVHHLQAMISSFATEQPEETHATAGATSNHSWCTLDISQSDMGGAFPDPYL